MAGDPRDYALGAAGGKRLLLKNDGADAGPGSVSLTVPTTTAARALVAQHGRLKLRVKVVFTPTGGSSSSQTMKVKLHR